MRLPLARLLLSVLLLALAACDSGGPDDSGGGDLRVTLSAPDVILRLNNQSLTTNTIALVATVEGTARVTGATISSPTLSVQLDSSVAAGTGRAHAYVTVGGNGQRTAPALGATTLTLTSADGTGTATMTVHDGDPYAPADGQLLTAGVQLVHGVAAPLPVTAPTRLAVAPAGLSLAGGALTATTAFAPNRVQRVIVHLADTAGRVFASRPVDVVARSTAARAGVRVRRHGLAGGTHYLYPELSWVAGVSQDGRLVTTSEPGGSASPALQGLRSLATGGGPALYLLYADGRVARALHGGEQTLTPLGNLDPADVAPDGTALLRDGSLWVTDLSHGWGPRFEALGRPFLGRALPLGEGTSFVAVTATRRVDDPVATSRLMVAADDTGRLWATGPATPFGPTAHRLPAVPVEMVTAANVPLFAARLADGSVWTWTATDPSDPATLTAPVRLDGLTAARLFPYATAVVVVRPDGRVATWRLSAAGGTDECPTTGLCERPAWAGLREAASWFYVDAEGFAVSVAGGGTRPFGAGQPPLVPAE